MKTRFIAILLIGCLGSCTKDEKIVKQTNVYLSGWFQPVDDPYSNGVGTIWKNGILILERNSISIDAISVSGNDVYAISGDVQGGGYWKNGVWVPLSTFGTATSIAVDDNHVIVGGYNSDEPHHEYGYWRDGNWIGMSGTVKAIAISQGSIYFGGTVAVPTVGSGPHPNFNVDYATYWKDNQEFRLSANSDGVGLAVSGNGDVFVAGTRLGQYYQATYWKNGAMVQLSPVNSHALAITVKDNDVYVVGSEGDNAVYWKNGAKKILPYEGTVSYALATGIALSGDDIYIIGNIVRPDGPRSIGYWKNEQWMEIKTGIGNSVSTAIVVQ